MSLLAAVAAFSFAVVTSQTVAGLALPLAGLALCTLGATLGPPAPAARPARRTSIGGLGARSARALALVCVLSLLCGQANAVVITGGTIAAVISAIWNVFQTIVALIGYALIILRFTSCWTLWFCITFTIFIGALAALSTANTMLGVTPFLDRILFGGAQCEPDEPDYGSYKPDRFKNRRRRSLDAMADEYIALLNEHAERLHAASGAAVYRLLESGTASMDATAAWFNTLAPAPPRRPAHEHYAELVALAAEPFYAF